MVELRVEISTILEAVMVLSVREEGCKLGIGRWLRSAGSKFLGDGNVGMDMNRP
jgi:hypothetical protein